MGLQYFCQNKKRRGAVRDHPTLNGIDYLEVLDQEAEEIGSPRQRTLLVRLLKPVPASLTSDNVQIRGGVRVTPVGVEWAFPALSIPGTLVSTDEQNFFTNLPDADHLLVVRTDSDGDFSTYRLLLMTSPTNPQPPSGFDKILSEVAFSFKVECPSDFDCETEQVCPPEQRTEPPINYLAKDYASFRQLMLDRMAVVMPDWGERNPADLGVALVEVLAYAADHLSYYQDAVATEAYLGTARRRVSVRRHARLLNYPMHDGSNARAWVTVQVEPGSSADGGEISQGTPFLTKLNAPRGTFDLEQLNDALRENPEVFEAMHNLTLHPAHHEMHFYTWGDDECCLPKGATRATLENRGNRLQNLEAGDVLIFEEVRGPESGKEADANPAHRHVVRLTHVEFTEDPLFTEDEAGTQPLRVVDIEWASEDALPFPLCLWEVEDPESEQKQPVSTARGNVLLVDHGHTIPDEELDDIPPRGRYEPKLRFGPLTQQGHVRDKENRLVPFDDEAPASAVFGWEMGNVQPAIRLIADGDETLPWLPHRDLLNSDRFAREFVVETEDDGAAQLRFGDDVLGKEPTAGTAFLATYRIGNGTAGNVGAEAIAHIVTPMSGIVDVRNPLPTTGGVGPETKEEVRLYAPQAFRKQERAVTEEDYAEVTERHREVQKAVATLRWTGSWYTMFITVDRIDGRAVDAEFEAELRRHLERFRMAGYDLEIDGPRFVPLDIAFTVCVEPTYFRSDVEVALLETFSNIDLPDGQRGFFHPDNFTFGQPVYLSQVVATAMQAPGVQWVDVEVTGDKPNRFKRWGKAPQGEFEKGIIKMERLEIARLDNDPNAQENGKIEFFMEGGL